MQPDRPQLAGAGVGVADLDRAIEWYRRLFELEIHSRFQVAALDLEICMLGRDSFSIELMAPASVGPFASPEVPPRHAAPGRIAHIAFEVSALASFAERLARYDCVELWRSPPGSPANFVFISDPDGNLIQIIEHRA